MPSRAALESALARRVSPWSRLHDGHLSTVHERAVPGDADASGELLESLASPGSVWPSDRWPALTLDRGMAVGSRGGHGVVRYVVTDHEPGRRVRFALTEETPFAGWHELSARPAPGQGSLWRHELVVDDPSPATIALVVPLHDALLEDLFDSVTQRLAGTDAQRRPLALGIRARRALSALRIRGPRARRGASMGS